MFAAVVGEEVQRDFRNWFDVIPQTSDPLIREVGGRRPLTFSELHAFAQDLSISAPLAISTMDAHWTDNGYTRDMQGTQKPHDDSEKEQEPLNSPLQSLSVSYAIESEFTALRLV